MSFLACPQSYALDDRDPAALACLVIDICYMAMSIGVSTLAIVSLRSDTVHVDVASIGETNIVLGIN